MSPRVAMVTLALVLSGLCGCVQEQRSYADPAHQPEWVRASALFVNVEVPRDTNGNGYVDNIPVIAYLFDDPRYPFAITQEGSFRWVLTTGDGKMVAEWDFNPEQANAMKRPNLPPGPGYQFGLSLLEDPAEEKLANQTLELFGSFTPTGGQKIQSSGTISIRVGRAGST